MPPSPRGPQHIPGVLHHRGGELLGYGRGSAGGGPEEDGVVLQVEDGPPAGPVLHAAKHLLERHALPEDKPQHQRGVSGRRRHGPGVEVREKQLEVVVIKTKLLQRHLSSGYSAQYVNTTIYRLCVLYICGFCSQTMINLLCPNQVSVF